MTQQQTPNRPGFTQWLLFLGLALWLAAVPLVVTATLSALTEVVPGSLVEFGIVLPREPAVPVWVFGLLTTALTLGLNLLVFVPLLFLTRRPGRAFLHTMARLLIAIALFQALNALPALIWPPEDLIPPMTGRTWVAAVRLLLGLAFLLLGLGWIEARHHHGSLRQAWRRVGLRLWLNASALWLALLSAAVIVGPWVLVGALGSPQTTAANLLQALPNALNEEILFRGFALAWLWRAGRGRTSAAVAALLLFVAAQGGTVLPAGDWGALLRFASALLLGLLLTELTVRAGGSIWPAVIVHLLYDWFHFAFVDPRSQEEFLHWLVQVWMPLAAGGLGLLLWFGRKMVGRLSTKPATPQARSLGTFAAACLAWLLVLSTYLTLGTVGFQPDGFLIIMEEQIDLGPATAIADPAERRAWVYQTLVETAERSQASLWTELDRKGLEYRPHYLVNMIEVEGRPGLRRAFAREPGVASVQFHPGARRYPRGLEMPGLDPGSAQGVEWNVREVGADHVWDLGYTGQGIVVGDADTGVAWEHPALQDAYRGWDGQVASHNYSWYDPWDGSAAPWDDHGHGTHTTGTMVGQDGKNRIGLAPDAQWIACRNMRYGLGNPGSYVGCMEFLLAPFPQDGDPLREGDPARGAHIVNNSWGCPPQEGCLPDSFLVAVEALRAAGQMMVVSAGNAGPACGTVQDPPAVYDASFSVGAIRQDGQVAGFSSRGPVTVDAGQDPAPPGDNDRLKPDIVAPGVDIRSSVPGGYSSSQGTSMAGPHVAGAVALLWSADPLLVGDVERTENLLAETAQPITVGSACADGLTGSASAYGLATVCGCAGDGPDSVPNHVYGWGLLDVWAAVQQALNGR